MRRKRVYRETLDVLLEEINGLQMGEGQEATIGQVGEIVRRVQEALEREE